ncbi:hypothetical protein MMC13_004487 [Lambiella insularis]|nr:hypothetical protein [Lambiella insularis]
MSNGPTPSHQLQGEIAQDGTFIRRRVSLSSDIAGRGTFDGSIWPYIYWLKITTTPDCHIWSFLVLLADSVPADFPNDLCARRLTPLVNTNLLRLWLSSCDEHHNTCNDQFWFQQERKGELSAFRVIDVLQKRIVRILPSERYATLSYVWGASTGFQATMSNIADLEHEGGLRKFEKSIPRTIRDAIRLVEDLGERYLWVDSLCLIQDDEENLLGMIQKMDLVYGHSYFTIIAASGKDAEAGLPGLQLERQGILQYVEEIQPGLKVAVCEHLESHLLKSVYETRAWTFQERIFSHRTIIFRENQVFFQCQDKTYSEDISTENREVSNWNVDVSSLPPPRLKKEAVMTQFQFMVDRYSSRNLTYSKDALRAFAGLSTPLSLSLQTPLIEGLPVKYLDSVLLWVSRANAKRRAGVPSWSWAGWTDRPDWNLTTIFLDSHMTARWLAAGTFVSWYYSDAGGTPSLIRNNSQAAYAWIQTDLSDPNETERLAPTHFQFHAEDFADVDLMGRPLLHQLPLRDVLTTAHSLPNTDIISPAPLSCPKRPYLHFWTLSLFFTLHSLSTSFDSIQLGPLDDVHHPAREGYRQMSDFDLSNDFFRLGLLDKHFNPCGFIILPKTYGTPLIGHICEFLILSEQSSWSKYDYTQAALFQNPENDYHLRSPLAHPDRPFKLWNVMLVEGHGGFEERVGERFGGVGYRQAVRRAQDGERLC